MGTILSIAIAITAAIASMLLLGGLHIIMLVHAAFMAQAIGAIHFGARQAKPPQLPAAARLTGAWSIYVAQASGSGAIIVLTALPDWDLWPLVSVVFAFVFALSVGQWLIERSRKHRAFDAARRANGLMCLWCNYDVSCLEQPDRCPECGKPFEADQARAAWARMGYGHDRWPESPDQTARNAQERI